MGTGAFMQTREEAEELSSLMIQIGKRYHKEVRTILSDMNTPLGNAVGNALEVEEALRVLRGEEKGEFYDLCVQLASEMVSMGKSIDKKEAKTLVEECIASGDAYHKFLEIVAAQGGEIEKLKVSEWTEEVVADQDGKIMAIDALEKGKSNASSLVKSRSY